MSALASVCLVVLLSERSEGCKEACLSHVTDPRVRATVCGRCFIEGDRGAWAASLADQSSVPENQLEGLLEDRDWAVRWGGVRALAKRKSMTEVRVLSDWVAAAPDKACSTAVHAAGAKHQTTAAVLQPAQAAACWERRVALTRQLEIEMYSELAATRIEAVSHLAAFLERPMTRIVLDAMKSRAPETDDLSAALLVEACHLGGPPAGKALLEVRKGVDDEALVNRLLPIWAKQIDGQRPLLKSEERQRRREAINVLADLAPLSGPELDGALDDPDPSNRRAAGMALARGEGQTLATFARKKLDAAAQVEPSVRLKWVAAVGNSQDPACRETLTAVIADTKLDEAVRSAAVPALVDCAGIKALDAVTELQKSKEVALRAGAALSLAGLPRQAEVPRRLAVAFADAEPAVLAAACHAAGVLRDRSVTAKLVELADHQSDAVRGEAVVALAALETPAAVPRLIRALTDDSSPRVREVAARALGELGTAAAVPALISASEGDKDTKVKFVAAESLRKLGFKRSSGSMSP